MHDRQSLHFIAARSGLGEFPTSISDPGTIITFFCSMSIIFVERCMCLNFCMYYTDVLGGYNGTIFAYGQTSSGKTHTMEVWIMIITYIEHG